MANAQKNSLVANINKRRRTHTSRSKANSTVSEKHYREMEEWSRERKRRSPGGRSKQ
jgi:hypothetical protein